MAYVTKQIPRTKLPYLPETMMLFGTKSIIIDHFQESDVEEIYAMMKDAVDEGLSYPQDSMDMEHFMAYYMAFHVFVIRDSSSHQVLAANYIKPNFPGRSSHICNMGILVEKMHRGQGLGELLMRRCFQFAKDLGYLAVFFNLVYENNTSSIKICRKLGMTMVGKVPNAGNMNGLGFVDALQFYYNLSAS